MVVWSIGSPSLDWHRRPRSSPSEGAIALGLGVLVILEALLPTGSLPGPLALLRDLPARRRRARRYARIVAIGVRHGLGGFLRGRARYQPGEDGPRVARALRLAFTDAGVTFVKLGQMLSTRPDLVGVEFARELGRLTTDAAPESWAVIRRTLAAELGTGVEEVFAEIEQEPLAAASVGQVHRARLREGSAVVVKIQRSDAAAQVAADIDIIGRLAARLERSTDWGRSLGLRSLADGFGTSLRQELDYRIEASNARSVAASLEASGGTPVRAPRVYAQWSGPRVLTMEQMAGTPSRKHTTYSWPCRSSSERRWLRPSWQRSCGRCWMPGSSTPTCTEATSSSMPTGHSRCSTSVRWGGWTPGPVAGSGGWSSPSIAATRSRRRTASWRSWIAHPGWMTGPSSGSSVW